MNVLILSTYEKTGGAAIAANRLLHALRKNGMEATMMCRRNISWWHGKPQSWSSIMERGMIWLCNGLSKKDLWSTDTALIGQDIRSTREYKEADVIHLHWINQSFLSISSIGRFIKDGKKVVWTMHDEWALDTIYHYTYGTENQQSMLARKVYSLKERLYRGRDITFVTCSRWLREISERKPLAQGQTVINIPNCIDTEIFKPVPHPNRRRVLFVSQNVNDERKGIRYLNEAAKQLDDVEIVALGRDIPYINNVEEMAKLYASFDAFVTPSLQDNLPNTIMEAMACGTPCVGFNVGGIPEMIDHRENGYIANYKDATDLAEGIRYVLSNNNIQRLGQAAREKVMNSYSERTVAEKYIKIYETD